MFSHRTRDSGVIEILAAPFCRPDGPPMLVATVQELESAPTNPAIILGNGGLVPLGLIEKLAAYVRREIMKQPLAMREFDGQLTKEGVASIFEKVIELNGWSNQGPQADAVQKTLDHVNDKGMLVIEPALPEVIVTEDGQLKCPGCGAVGGEWRYLEDIVNHRDVRGLEDGVLWIHGFYSSGEGYDDGHNGRLECHAEDEQGRSCLCECKIPDGMEVDFD
jgi:hypothetical protein